MRLTINDREYDIPEDSGKLVVNCAGSLESIVVNGVRYYGSVTLKPVGGRWVRVDSLIQQPFPQRPGDRQKRLFDERVANLRHQLSSCNSNIRCKTEGLTDEQIEDIKMSAQEAGWIVSENEQGEYLTFD